VILPITHDIEHVEAKAATCTEPGNIEYWYCKLCGFAWLDEYLHLNTNLKAIVLPATGHTPVEVVETCAGSIRGCVEDHVVKCSVCDAELSREHMFLMGDVNLDGKVTLADATMIYEKYVLNLPGLSEFNDIQKVLGNVNLRGEITLADATQVYEYVLKVFDNTLAEGDWEPYLVSIEVE
jgi:hypothetical protein